MRLEGGQRSEGFLLLLLFCLTCVVREEKGNMEYLEYGISKKDRNI